MHPQPRESETEKAKETESESERETERQREGQTERMNNTPVTKLTRVAMVTGFPRLGGIAPITLGASVSDAIQTVSLGYGEKRDLAADGRVWLL